MYLQFFGLAEKPFAITPDPRYLYLSGRHADALAHLVYGINEAGGFIQLTGEVGTGKTTTIRSLLARAPKNAEIALILNPRLSAAEFLRSLCEELGLGADDSGDGDTKNLVDLFNRYLLRAHGLGRRVVLVVDEARNLTPDVLEQVRLLTNLETETQKLLQIILIGQPELRKLLAREDLRQIAQRITARYHLDPLSREETFAYVRHRLRVAGATTDIFTRAALREIYRISGGIPRVINILCDRALLAPTRRNCIRYPALWCAAQEPRFSATNSCPAGCRPRRPAWPSLWWPVARWCSGVTRLPASFRPSRMPRTRPWRPMRRLPQLPQPPSPAPQRPSPRTARRPHRRPQPRGSQRRAPPPRPPLRITRWRSC